MHQIFFCSQQVYYKHFLVKLLFSWQKSKKALLKLHLCFIDEFLIILKFIDTSLHLFIIW